MQTEVILPYVKKRGIITYKDVSNSNAEICWGYLIYIDLRIIVENEGRPRIQVFNTDDRDCPFIIFTFTCRNEDNEDFVVLTLQGGNPHWKVKMRGSYISDEGTNEIIKSVTQQSFVYTQCSTVNYSLSPQTDHGRVLTIVEPENPEDKMFQLYITR